MSVLNELLRLTAVIGKRTPNWVQGAGGNTSVKIADKGVTWMWVKSSGLRLDETVHESHFSKLSVHDVARRLEQINGEEDANELAYAEVLRGASESAAGRRPSMETGFHIFLPRPYVLHFHALPALLMAHEFRTNRPKAEAWMAAHWSGGFEFVEPCMPGWTLTTRLKASGGVSLIVLESHGLILQGMDGSVLDRWETLETEFCRDFNYSLNDAGSLPATPMRIYFPDTAVFLNRLRAVLIPAGSVGGEPVFQLCADACGKDKDATELWNATALLYRACPSLNPLPEAIASRVAGLPTEKFRQSLGAAPGSSHAS